MTISPTSAAGVSTLPSIDALPETISKRTGRFESETATSSTGTTLLYCIGSKGSNVIVCGFNAEFLAEFITPIASKSKPALPTQLHGSQIG
ncbi:unknown [Coraliomargarita sp. CAG:312]|nr:unknown [Coraliomargarita sp. CAG:312]